MNEVDYTGWTRTKENLNLIRTKPKYRRSLHFQRFIKAIKYRRWDYFTWWNIKGLLFNQIEQFQYSLKINKIVYKLNKKEI